MVLDLVQLNLFIRDFRSVEVNKKQIFQAILFMFIFLFLLQTVTYMLRTNGDVKDRFTGFYGEKNNSIDVIMIGSSPVHPYFSAPKLWGEYGIASYPLSTNQQRPEAAPFLIKEAFKTQNPKLFIFELRQYGYETAVMTANMAHTRGVTDNLKYSPNRIKLINALVDEPSERLTYYIDIFKYHSNWKTLILPEQISAFSYEKLHPLKGFTYEERIVASQKYDYSDVKEKMPIPIEREKNLYDLLHFLKANHIEALFILSPKVMDKESQMMYNYMESIVKEFDYNFLDFNKYYEELELDFATDFYDGGAHANVYGADKCTAFLGSYLKENYSLPDRRADKTYETWNTSYTLWTEKLIDSLNNRFN